VPELAPHALAIPASGSRRTCEPAQELDDVIHLHVGAPDLSVAPHVLAAGARAWTADVTHLTGGDVAGWTERLLREHRAAVAPGAAFGASGQGRVRGSAASSRADLLEGLRRLSAVTAADGHTGGPEQDRRTEG